MQDNLDEADFEKQFGDLKSKIKDMSREDWESLPES